MSEPLPSFFARVGIALACFFRALGDASFARFLDEALRGETHRRDGLRGAAEVPSLGPAPSAPSGATIPALPSLRTTEPPRGASALHQVEGAAIAPAPAPGGPGAPVAVTTVAVVASLASPAIPASPAVAKAPDPATAQEGALYLLALLQREGRLLDFCEEELASFSDAAVGAAARLVHAGCRKAVRENLELAPVRSEAEGAKVTVPPGFDARALRLSGNIVGNPPFTGSLKHHGWKVASVKLPEPPRGEAALLLAPAEVELP